MSALNLNITQEAQLLRALYESTASSVVPTHLLESFILGVFLAFVPIGSYLLWAKSHSPTRTPFISLLWLVLVTLMTHWVLSFRQFDSTLAGRPLGISLSHDGHKSISHAVNATAHGIHRHAHPKAAGNGVILGSIYVFGQAWRHLLPLITETILFGFTSSLFAVAVYTNIRHSFTHWRTCSDLILPVIASVMYVLSLTHWAITLRCFALISKYATSIAPLAFQAHINGLDLGLLTVFSISAVMSDSIVLWRMCVVWGNNRAVRAFGTLLLVATLGLNIANIIFIERIMVDSRRFRFAKNSRDSELIPTYGLTSVGLAAAFVSLASNFCATMLVGIKAWLHRRQVSQQFRSDTRRTLVGRVLELLVESGIVYTAIWVLYCTSFFRPITAQTVFGPASSESLVTAVDHLDGAMAQLTSIYPLAVFILIALDKIHHTRGPQTLRGDEWPKGRNYALNFSLEIGVHIERSTSLSPGVVAHRMVAFSCPEVPQLPTVDDIKAVDSTQHALP